MKCVSDIQQFEVFDCRNLQLHYFHRPVAGGVATHVFLIAYNKLLRRIAMTKSGFMKGRQRFLQA
jgi:hypothetical protein